MQIARLEGFYWVARTGGYAAAARAFPYPPTQPAAKVSTPVSHPRIRMMRATVGS